VIREVMRHTAMVAGGGKSQTERVHGDDPLRRWACRIRISEPVRELPNWICVTTSLEVDANRRRRPFAYELPGATRSIVEGCCPPIRCRQVSIPVRSSRPIPKSFEGTCVVADPGAHGRGSWTAVVDRGPAQIVLSGCSSTFALFPAQLALQGVC
jgi:hypothetical protein